VVEQLLQHPILDEADYFRTSRRVSSPLGDSKRADGKDPVGDKTTDEDIADAS
jgi:hypothetical protein